MSQLYIILLLPTTNKLYNAEKVHNKMCIKFAIFVVLKFQSVEHKIKTADKYQQTLLFERALKTDLVSVANVYQMSIEWVLTTVEFSIICTFMRFDWRSI